MRPVRAAALTLLLAAATTLGCGKSEGVPVSSTGTGKTLASTTAADRLKKAGWTVTSSEDRGENWSALSLKLDKGDDQVRSASVWIDAFGESSVKGAPKPHLTIGKGELLRYGWTPSAGKPVPDLATFARDISAFAPAEKATDTLFASSKFDSAVKKWGMKQDGSRSGARVSPGGVVYNHRFLYDATGLLTIEIVYYEKAVKAGDARLLGTTLVEVKADDEPTKKAIFEVLSAG